MTEQTLIGGDAHLGVLHLATFGLASQLPGELAGLSNRLGGHGFAEAGQAARRIDRQSSAQRGGALPDHALGLARLAEAQVLVPVELQSGGQVIHLGDVDIFGAEAGLLVGGVPDALLEGPLRQRVADR